MENVYQNPKCRDSVESSASASRKTSTASDYTPENTHVLSSRPILMNSQTNVSYAAETVVNAQQGSQRNIDTNNTGGNEQFEGADHTDALKTELNNSLLQKDVGKLLPGQKVNLRVFVMSIDQQNEVKNEEAKASEPAQEINDVRIDDNAVMGTENSEVKSEKPSEPALKVPQRKISRFLVSPVLSGQLDLPKDKDFGIETPEPHHQNSVEPAVTEIAPRSNLQLTITLLRLNQFIPQKQ